MARTGGPPSGRVDGDPGLREGDGGLEPYDRVERFPEGRLLERGQERERVVDVVLLDREDASACDSHAGARVGVGALQRRAREQRERVLDVFELTDVADEETRCGGTLPGSGGSHLPSAKGVGASLCVEARAELRPPASAGGDHRGKRRVVRL